MKNCLEQILDHLKKEGYFDWPVEECKDKVNMPKVIELIENYDLSFNLGTAAGHILMSTGNLDNLKLASWYLNREIERLEKKEQED